MATATIEEASATSQKPIKTIRLRGISASIFANKAKTEAGERTFHKVSLQRSYKDGDDWKTTTSFGRDDLPVVQLVLQRAWEAILDMKSASAKEEDAD